MKGDEIRKLNFYIPDNKVELAKIVAGHFGEPVGDRFY